MHSQVKKLPEKSDKNVINRSASLPRSEVGNFSPGFSENPQGTIATQLKLEEKIDANPRVHQLMAYQDIANSHTSKTVQRKNIIERDKGTDKGTDKNDLIQKKEADSNLPSGLQFGIEKLSGRSMDDVQVHRNSDQPAQLQAHAFAQGTDIHLGPGQEKHLPHEAWHVAQQKQGRVEPTAQLMSEVAINDDQGLEKEADVMGAKALRIGNSADPLQRKSIHETSAGGNKVVQRQGADGSVKPTPKKKKTLKLEGEIKGFGTAVKNLFTSGTNFTKLKKEVDKYNAASAEDQEKLEKGIETLALAWLKDHSADTDPNDLAKRESILGILKEFRKGELTQEAVKSGVFQSEEHADSLGFSEQKAETEVSKTTKEFVTPDGKIEDKKGLLSDTSFMSKMHEVMKEKVISVEQNLGQIDNNEKTLRADAAIHTFFESEKTKADAAGPDERRSVTAHAKEAYAGGFHSKIIEKVKFPNTDETKKSAEEDDLSAAKLTPYRESSKAGANEVHSLNDEAETDLATLYTLSEQVLNLKTKEEESFTSGLGAQGDQAQANRQQVKMLVEDAILYAQKVQLEKEKSSKLVAPLEADGRMAGFWRKTRDMAKTIAADQVTKFITLGLVSVSPAYTVGGLASSESFNLQEDSEGNLTDVVVHEGSRGGSKYNFNGPKTIVGGILRKIKETGTKASKFKNKQPITGFFIFSGVLQQFEKGLAYINQIAAAIQKWASGLSLIPGAAAITTPIAAVCEAIKKAVSLITQSSKAARMIFTSLVKIMNDDPQLWGLVSQNFNAGIAENLVTLGAKGAELGYAAGTSPLIGKDAGEGATDHLKGISNLDSKSIESDMMVTPEKAPSLGVKALGMGGSGLDAVDSVVSGGLVEDEMSKGLKEDKKAVARPARSIDAFKTAAKNAVPKSQPVISGTETVLNKSDQTESLAEKITPEVQKAETEQNQQVQPDNPESVAASQEFADKASTTKEESKDIASTTGVVKQVATEVVKAGNVATMRALWEKRIKQAEEEKERMKGQSGSGIK